MSRLYTYILRFDGGAAPNPFRGMCTLAICKPKIRSSAKPGDWVAGVGSCDAPSRDLSGRLIYAMKVEEVVSLEVYDERAPRDWPHRIPVVTSLDLSARLGDCIYDYHTGRAVQRRGVHGPENVERDLGGRNVLISRDFYYFGSRARELPPDLLDICPTTQGHRSTANQPYLRRFESWLRGLSLQAGQLYGWPDYLVDWSGYDAPDGCLPCTGADDAEEEDARPGRVPSGCVSPGGRLP